MSNTVDEIVDEPILPQLPPIAWEDMSLAEQLSTLSDEERDAALAELDPEAVLYDWNVWGRPEQQEPEDDWHLWAAVAGRGFGKTRLLAEWVRKKAREYPGCRISLVARTAADARDVIVNGESGVMAVCPPGERPEYFPSRRMLEFPNGSTAQHFSAAEPDQLRGPQFHFSAVDELAAWNHVPGMDGLTAWDQVQVATRLGDAPKIVVATTPKRVPAMKSLLERVNEPGVIITRGSTMRNRANLSRNYLNLMASLYAGTAIGRQELEGLLLDDVEGALWTEDLIGSARALTGLPQLPYRVVAVDPSVAEQPRDECGIMVVGGTSHAKLHQRHAFVLEDATVHGSPGVWAKQVVETAKKWKVAGVVAEGNQGGELVRMAIQAIDPNIKVFTVHARQNKALRAEPVVAAYEKKRVHHVGYLGTLEAQMTSWEPGVTKKSPDRVDSLVYGVLSVIVKPPKGLFSLGRVRARSSANKTVPGVNKSSYTGHRRAA
jgi:phage terminase large subunit-like protein